jgi:hypothetical protein
MAARYGVYGASWTFYTVTPPDVGGGPTIGAGVARTGNVLRNTGSQMQRAAAGVGVWAADWLWIGATDQTLSDGGYLSDGAGHVFVVAAPPETDRGVLLAPLTSGQLPT